MKKTKGIPYAQYRKATKKMPAHYHIFNDVYDFNVRLFIGQVDKMNDYLPELNITKATDGKTWWNPDTGSLSVWIQKKGDFDVLAHELIHVISALLETRGIKFDPDNDEPIAYLMTWLFRAFYFAVK